MPFVFYAFCIPSGDLHTDICTRTHPISEAQEDLVILPRLSRTGTTNDSTSQPQSSEEAVPAKPSGENLQDIYTQLVERIIAGVKALKAEYPHFATVDTQAKISRSSEPDRFYVQFEYEHAVKRVPDPQYNPDSGKKQSQTLKVFEEDGLWLSMHFFKGSWRGTAIVRPTVIGDLNIVVFLDGLRTTPEFAAINQRIDQIIQKEAVWFRQ